jgi:AraC family transcriptional regulator
MPTANATLTMSLICIFEDRRVVRPPLERIKPCGTWMVHRRYFGMARPAIVQRDFEGFSVRLRRYEPFEVMPRHAHDEHGVSVVLGGSLSEDTCVGSATSTAGWNVTKPRGTFHANRFGPHGAVLLSISFQPFAHRLTEWRWSQNLRAWRTALRLLRLSRARGGVENEDVVETVAATLDLTDGREPGWLRTVRESIDDAPTRAARVTELASRHGVHPVYLARRFRAAYGTSIREYTQMVRVRRASTLIVGTREPLSSIAHTCGFADHSHMCRAFRVVMGINPDGLRA